MADHNGFEDKIDYFRAVTGLNDPDLCTEILSAHNWDLELAISSITSNPNPNPSSSNHHPTPSTSTSLQHQPQQSPTLAWKLITLPFYVVSGALGLGFWIAGSVLSRSLNLLGLLPPNPTTADQNLIPISASSAEPAEFIASFNRDFETATRPNFVAEGFMAALQRSQREFRLMFVYLHSPDHPDVPEFCLRCLCSDAVAAFVNENFVAWGGSIRGTEGFKMSNSLKALRFPFCAVVMAGANQKIILLAQVLVRFPNGERKERRFPSTATIESLYDYVDSLDCLSADKYSLVSNFPRVLYGPEKHSITLKEAGLHPRASLFVEVES